MSTEQIDDSRIPRSAWRTAVLGGMASYLDAGVLVTSGVAFSLVIPSLHLTTADVGLLSGLVTGLLAIGALVGGRLGDKFGRRRIIAVDLFVFAAGVLLLTTAVNSEMLYIGVIITGLAMGIDLPVSIALVAEAAPKRHRGKMVSFGQIMWGLGPVVTLVLNAALSAAGVAPDLLARILWAHLFIVSLVVIFLRRRLPESAEWQEAAEEAFEGQLSGPITTIGSVKAARLRMLLPFTVPLIVVGLFYTIGGFAPAMGGQFTFFILTQVVHMPISSASLVLLTIAPIALVLGIIYMRVVDTKLRYPLMIAGGVLAIAGYLVPIFAGITAFTYLLSFYAGLVGANFIGETLYKVRTQEIFPPLVRGTASGATIFLCRISTAVLAVFTPALATGDLRFLLGILGLCMLVTLGLGIWLMRLRSHDATPAAETEAERAPKLASA